MARKILLDCDPGLDDAVALLVAHGHPGLELVAVTTVHGNRPLPDTARNALAVAEAAGIGTVPVAAGCDRPLTGDPPSGDDPRRTRLHGPRGLGDVELAPPTRELDARHAGDLIVGTVLDGAPGELTLVAVGPLTNLATAVRKDPRIVARVREVVLMGGRGGQGGPEFNVAADPEAAAVVLGQDWDVTVVGLDMTSRAAADPAVEQRLWALGTAPGALAARLVASSRTRNRAVRGLTDPPVHDPCAVAHVADPRVLIVRPATVRVALTGPGRGATAVGPPGPGARTRVAVGLDRQRHWALVVAALAGPGPVHRVVPPGGAGH